MSQVTNTKQIILDLLGQESYEVYQLAHLLRMDEQALQTLLEQMEQENLVKLGKFSDTFRANVSFVKIAD